MTGSGRYLDKAYGITRDEQAREMYEAWAETYDEEVSENEYRQPERCAQMLGRFCGPTETSVFDVGCGTGLSGIALKAHGFGPVDGCDLSPAMLEKAGATGAYRSLFEANLNHPPLDIADDTYGAATAVGIFSFGHVNAVALEEIVRIVRPGGFVVIGLNEHFYDEGSLTSQIEKMVAAGRIAEKAREHGDHLPGTGTTGWVLALQVR